MTTTQYEVWATPKDGGYGRVVFVGTEAEAAGYVERNTSPDNFERYEVEPASTYQPTEAERADTGRVKRASLRPPRDLQDLL